MKEKMRAPGSQALRDEMKRTWPKLRIHYENWERRQLKIRQAEKRKIEHENRMANDALYAASYRLATIIERQIYYPDDESSAEG